MRVLRLAVGCAVLLGVAACDSGEAQDVVMPDVVGSQLDLALADIEEAGFTDEVDLDGGGLFGVVDESNWQVCGQSPAPGEPVSDTPRLTVDRSCGDATTAEAEEPTSEATDEPAAEPSEEPSDAAAEVLTVDNSADLAALLAADSCSDLVAGFAETYEDSVIQFDGYIGAMNHHGDYETRYDILIGAGDFSETSAPGPAMQFRDVNVTNDLHLTGPNVPDTIGVRTNLRVTAKVAEFETASCLLLLEPVSTEVR